MCIKAKSLPIAVAKLIVLFWVVDAPSLTSAQETAKAENKSNNPSSDGQALVYPIKGWSIAETVLQDFQVGIDQTVRHSGKGCAYIKARTSRSKAGVLRQTLMSDLYRGQRIRLFGYLKADQIDGWAGLWMRVDDENGERLSLDNMQNRPIKGTTDWKRYEVVLDVPPNSVAVAFGFFLAGKGQVWADDFSVESVGSDVAITEIYGKSGQSTDTADQLRRKEAYSKRLKDELKTRPIKPFNLDFEAFEQ